MNKSLLLLVLYCTVSTCISSQLVINVTRSGHDQPSCLLGKSNCSTIYYALSAITNYTADIAINVYYNHNFTPVLNGSHGDSDNGNHSDLMFHNVENIMLIGHPSVNNEYITLTCPVLGAAGLYFDYSVNITILHLSFINCGMWHPTTANANWTNCHGNDRDCLIMPKAVSAIFMYNCTDVILDHTYFTSNRGSGISLYNVVGVVNITNSVFINHTTDGVPPCEATPANQSCSLQSTGVYIEFMYCPEFTETCSVTVNTNIAHVKYNISNCRFQGNNNKGAYHDVTDIPTPMELVDNHHWPFGRGGGLGIMLRVSNLEHLTLKIYNNIFINNSAIYGGGMYLLLQCRYPDHNVYVLKMNEFTNNTVSYNGGGLCVTINVLYVTNVTEVTLTYEFRNKLYIAESNFTNNIAYWGGGMAFTAYPLNTSYILFQTVKCSFIHNVYSGGGGAVGLLRKEKPEKEYFFIASAQFYGCNFTHTGPILAKGTSQQIMSSSVHSEGIQISFFNVTIFADNSATALRLSDTGAIFYDRVLFKNNTGFNGGGVSLLGKSWITLVNGLNMSFIDNTAIQYGGGIYYNPSPVMYINMTSTCFVWYQAAGNIDVPVQYWWVNVSFVNNTAYQAGHAAYITDPQQCVWPKEASLFDSNRTKVFNYNGQTKKDNVISTPSKHLTFVSTSSQFRSASNSNDYAHYSVMPGESIQLQLVTKDSLGGNIQSTVVCVSCHFRNDYEFNNHQIDVCNNNTEFNIDNYNRQVLSGNQLKGFKLYGPSNHSNNELLIVFKTVDPIPVVLPLLIQFKECVNGFQYDSNMKSCICLQEHSGDLSTPLVCVTNMTSTIETPCVRRDYWYGKLHDNRAIYHYCRSDSCRAHYDTNDNSCEDYQGYFKLPPIDSDLCTNGLTGPLCSECKEGESLSYDSYKCVNCNGIHKIGLIILILFECLVIVLILLGFLKLNFHVSTSFFYGFLYFYSVLKLLLWIPLPTALDAIIGAITAMTSLDFELLQYTGMCFSNFRAIHYEALHYVYPVAVALMILTIIKIDQSGLRRSQFFTGESSIQALCIILLIIYTSVSVTSLNIILPLRYQTPNNNNPIWFVHVDPGLRYMDTHNHLPFWLLAVSIELLLVLPFSLLMFFAPWLMRLINISRIKPILDEYQNCFHDNYRWFPGVYLLGRQIMYLVSSNIQSPELTAYLQQIVCLSLLILTATLHPYRNKILNIIDILLLSLLTFLSFTTSSSNGRQVYLGQEYAQETIVGIVCIGPCVVMVTVVLIVGIKKFFFLSCLGKRFGRFKMQSVITDEISSSNNNTSDNDTMSLWTTMSSSTRYKNTYDDDDLPPRFYDEERIHTRREERTPLLTTTINKGGTVSAPTTIATRGYSINDKPITN